MPIGPGKFDEECTRIREATNAAACVLMVFGDTPGSSGFSVQLRGDCVLDLPGILHQIAQDMEHDLKQRGAKHGTC